MSVSAQAAAKPVPTFELATFAPGWGAAVMGTAAVSVALAAAAQGADRAAPWLAGAADAMLMVAVLVGLTVLWLTAARWARHRSAAVEDLRHPVKGGMTATAAGGLLTLALALGKVGPGLLPMAVVEPLVVVLTVTGALLALIIGWVFLGAVFTSHDGALPQVSGAWFVPAVVTILVPLALVPVIDEHPGAAADVLPWAWGFLGVGAVLYLVVTAALFIRSIAHPLPVAALAPTLFIGVGPAGLLGLDLLRLAQVSVSAGGWDPILMQAALPVATMLWGFGLWWMVAALLVLRRGYGRLGFALSWWGFTFPLAAWTIAAIALAEAWNSAVLAALGWAGLAALMVLWVVVAGRTVAGIRSGAIWHH